MADGEGVGADRAMLLLTANTDDSRRVLIQVPGREIVGGELTGHALALTWLRWLLQSQKAGNFLLLILALLHRQLLLHFSAAVKFIETGLQR